MPPAATKKPTAKKEEERTEGSGKLWLPNGDVYMGEYYEEGPVKKRQGKGKYIMHCPETAQDEDIPEEIRNQEIPVRLPQDVVLLNGTWEADAFVSGTIRFGNGAEYTGNIDEKGFYVGGRYTWPDGSWYEGDFSRNVIHGNGSYYSSATNQVSKGVFRNNQGPGLEERYK